MTVQKRFVYFSVKLVVNIIAEIVIKNISTASARGHNFRSFVTVRGKLTFGQKLTGFPGTQPILCTYKYTV